MFFWSCLPTTTTSSSSNNNNNNRRIKNINGVIIIIIIIIIIVDICKFKMATATTSDAPKTPINLKFFFFIFHRWWWWFYRPELNTRNQCLFVCLFVCVCLFDWYKNFIFKHSGKASEKKTLMNFSLCNKQKKIFEFFCFFFSLSKCLFIWLPHTHTHNRIVKTKYWRMIKTRNSFIHSFF